MGILPRNGDEGRRRLGRRWLQQVSWQYGSYLNRPNINCLNLNPKFRGRFRSPISPCILLGCARASARRVLLSWTVVAASSLLAAMLPGCGGITVKNGSTTTSGGSAASLHSVQCANATIFGSTSDSCTVSLTGPAPLSGVSVALSSSNAAVAVPSSVTIPSGAISVSFTISISAVATSQSTTINATVGSLSANVVIQLHPSAPMLTVDATSISFGSVPISTTSTQSLALASTGSQPVTVSAISVSGADFSISGATLPITLTPGESVMVDLAFAPSVSGTETGQLTITSNSASSPTDAIRLSGIGVVAAHSVTLTWDAPASSPDPVAGYNIYRTTGSSTAYQLLNTGLDAQKTYVDYGVQGGLTYTYIVRSVDAQGVESAPSNTTNATIP